MKIINDSRQELVTGLIQQLKVYDKVAQECMGANGVTNRQTMHGIVLTYGVGRYGSRLPPGLRKRAWKQCFQHATELMLTNPERYIYCEGFGVRMSLGITTGEHAWVLDRERDWAVVDNTWAKPVTGIYLGIPFSYDFVVKCLMGGAKVYGVLDRYDLRHPVLTEPSNVWLHEIAASIPKAFEP